MALLDQGQPFKVLARGRGGISPPDLILRANLRNLLLILYCHGHILNCNFVSSIPSYLHHHSIQPFGEIKCSS